MPPTKPVRVPRESQPRRKRPVVGFLDPGMFLDTITELGLWFRWSRAVQCPCRLNDDTDQFDPTCTFCGGDGWWYINPELESQRGQGPATNAPANRNYLRIQCAFSQAGIDPKMHPFGYFYAGDAVLAMQNQMRVAFRDRFIGEQQEMAYTELLERNTASTDVPVGKSKRSTAQQRTAMRYEPVYINMIARKDGTDMVLYREGVDWVLTDPPATEPRKVRWLAGRGPGNGELYTVHYTCRPVWIVDQATYAVQFARGPAEGIKGPPMRQELPTAFKVRLDFLTQQEGT